MPYAQGRYLKTTSPTSGSRGGAPGARPPPNGRGPVFYAQNANFSQFSSLASLAINFKHSFNS